MKQDYDSLKQDGKDFPILMTSRFLFCILIILMLVSRENILAQKEQDPDPDQALRYYQVRLKTRYQNFNYFFKATFNYTENLREVLTNLRLKLR